MFNCAEQVQIQKCKTHADRTPKAACVQTIMVMVVVLMMKIIMIIVVIVLKTAMLALLQSDFCPTNCDTKVYVAAVQCRSDSF